MSNTPVPADDTTWDYQLGYNEGEKFERDRIVRLLELEVSEWLSQKWERLTEGNGSHPLT